jgi:hypothetical protein
MTAWSMTGPDLLRISRALQIASLTAQRTSQRNLALSRLSGGGCCCQTAQWRFRHVSNDVSNISNSSESPENTDSSNMVFSPFPCPKLGTRKLPSQWSRRSFGPSCAPLSSSLSSTSAGPGQQKSSEQACEKRHGSGSYD